MIRSHFRPFSRPCSLVHDRGCSPSAVTAFSPLLSTARRHFLLSPQPEQARHQRRFSSSHPSRPNNGSSDRSSARPAQSQPTSRFGRRKCRTGVPSADANIDAFSHLPRVAATPHLDLNGVAISSFYSLHRPIHVNNGFTPVDDSTSAVDAFLDQGVLRGPTVHPNQVMNTLGSIVKALGGNPGQIESHQENDEAALQTMISNHVSRLSLFHTPLAPLPMDLDRSKPFHDLQALQKRADGGAAVVSSRSKEMASMEDEDSPIGMTATLVISDNDQHDQGVEYQMSIPIDLAERLDAAELQGRQQDDSPNHIEQPFMRRLLLRALRTATSPSQIIPGSHTMSSLLLEQPTPAGSSVSGGAIASALRHPLWHSRIRQRHAQRVQMQLISVKRRRRLKIKKHKHKKLLKRTRTLRRKLGQL